jgi:hypothetical protein
LEVFEEAAMCPTDPRFKIQNQNQNQNQIQWTTMER